MNDAGGGKAELLYARAISKAKWVPCETRAGSVLRKYAAGTNRRRVELHAGKNRCTELIRNRIFRKWVSKYLLLCIFCQTSRPVICAGRLMRVSHDCRNGGTSNPPFITYLFLSTYLRHNRW